MSHEHEHAPNCGCEEDHGSQIVLFQGDSITDCFRDHDDPGSLGTGYVMLISAWYQALHPGAPVAFVNRGISGNRVKDLAARWDADCLEIGPALVTILIGINDTWRRYDSNDPTPVEAFEDAYYDVLNRTIESTDAQIVLMEPFSLPVPDDRKAWREDLDPKIQSVRHLAREFGAMLIPLDGIFAQASSKREPAFWTPDGVHPSPCRACVDRAGMAGRSARRESAGLMRCRRAHGCARRR